MFQLSKKKHAVTDSDSEYDSESDSESDSEEEEVIFGDSSDSLESEEEPESTLHHQW